ncbi:nucleoside diphosphate-linked moiety X motif 17 [Phaenicophaeus curvirostris]|uniref:nucleoside diphosphate-linked moiety X motif 17 n=1 Tax=Phaenicophaeus curvirostris TaxID=33595 RepID=UPI0037F09B8A
MAGAARVLVHVRRGGGVGGPAPFGQSVTGTLCPAHEDAVLVNCRLHGDRFILALPVPYHPSTLQRPPFCPAKRLGQRGERPVATLEGSGVAVGVATLLQASGGRILLTRRARRLSTFPGLWVPPGGMVEPGEELLGVGLRELQEETGLRLRAGGFSWRMLGLWESVFPALLSWGSPSRHSIVAYLLLRCAEPHEQLEARMRPSESEVSAYAWLEPPVLAAVAATEDGAENLGSIPHALPASIPITELSDGGARSTRIPTQILLRTIPTKGDDVERVSTGTKFALRLWLDSLGKQE